MGHGLSRFPLNAFSDYKRDLIIIMIPNIMIDNLMAIYTSIEIMWVRKFYRKLDNIYIILNKERS